jgi:hypothetical protein
LIAALLCQLPQWLVIHGLSMQNHRCHTRKGLSPVVAIKTHLNPFAQIGRYVIKELDWEMLGSYVLLLPRHWVRRNL